MRQFRLFRAGYPCTMISDVSTLLKSRRVFTGSSKKCTVGVKKLQNGRRRSSRADQTEETRDTRRPARRPMAAASDPSAGAATKRTPSNTAATAGGSQARLPIVVQHRIVHRLHLAREYLAADVRVARTAGRREPVSSPGDSSRSHTIRRISLLTRNRCLEAERSSAAPELLGTIRRGHIYEVPAIRQADAPVQTRSGLYHKEKRARAGPLRCLREWMKPFQGSRGSPPGVSPKMRLCIERCSSGCCLAEGTPHLTSFSTTFFSERLRRGGRARRSGCASRQPCIGLARAARPQPRDLAKGTPLHELSTPKCSRTAVFTRTSL